MHYLWTIIILFLLAPSCKTTTVTRFITKDSLVTVTVNGQTLTDTMKILVPYQVPVKYLEDSLKHAFKIAELERKIKQDSLAALVKFHRSERLRFQKELDFIRSIKRDSTRTIREVVKDTNKTRRQEIKGEKRKHISDNKTVVKTTRIKNRYMYLLLLIPFILYAIFYYRKTRRHSEHGDNNS